jgi:hypothetical protein
VLIRSVALRDRDPSLPTHREIDATLALLSEHAECGWVGTDTERAPDLDEVDALWLLPGTPYRDDATAHAAIGHCLETSTPFLGTCGGFQYACVELARRRAGLTGAVSAELQPDGEDLVVAPLACTLYYGLAGEYVSALQDAGVAISSSPPPFSRRWAAVRAGSCIRCSPPWLTRPGRGPACGRRRARAWVWRSGRGRLRCAGRVQ